MARASSKVVLPVFFPVPQGYTPPAIAAPYNGPPVLPVGAPPSTPGRTPQVVAQQPRESVSVPQRGRASVTAPGAPRRSRSSVTARVSPQHGMPADISLDALVNDVDVRAGDPLAIDADVDLANVPRVLWFGDE